MRIIIVGGGVIGTSLAHRLASRGAEVVVVERGGVACAASGHSGGFLALDWCDGGPLEALARRSFALHGELAATIDDDWGYRRVITYAGKVGPADRAHGVRLGWTAADLAVTGRLGTAETTAQVDPAAFTRAMMRAAERHGARLRIGEVTGLRRRDGRVVGIELGSEAVDADAVVIAMGPWSAAAARWLPLPPVFGLKGHSAVFDTGDEIPPEALFLEVEDASGDVLTPEVFPRADGTTYVCAISTEPALPRDPAAVAPDEGAVERLLELCRRISPALVPSRLLGTGACFRPITRDGVPLIGAVPGIPGAYVATGHGVWGILNAPATAEALAELILSRHSWAGPRMSAETDREEKQDRVGEPTRSCLDGAARSVDLRPFDPIRLTKGRPVPARRALSGVEPSA